MEGSRSRGRQSQDFLQGLATIAGLKTTELLQSGHDRNGLQEHGCQRQTLIWHAKKKKWRLVNMNNGSIVLQIATTVATGKNPSKNPIG